jgi:hypothetical protein
VEANTPIILAVAAHPDPDRAGQDFAAIWESRPLEPSAQLSVAELERDTAGSLRVARYQRSSTNVAWGSALLAAALVLVVPTAGARFLASMRSVGGTGAVADHLHRTIPRKERDRATGLLEGHESGVVVLAVNLPAEDIELHFAQATETLVMVSWWDGLDRAIEQEIADAQVNPSGT